MRTVPSKPNNSTASASQRQSTRSPIGGQHEAICDEEHLITESQAADLLAIALKTVRNWRHLGRGPPHLKLGRLVRYRMRDLNVWLESCERASTSDRGDGHV
jgi:predicted DNA-binding transcriptional regulator AlpA